MFLDLLHVFAASAVLLLFMAGSVYWLLSLTDLFRFSEQRLVTRLALTCASSVALTPGVLYLLSRFAGFTPVYLLLALSFVASLVFFIRDLRLRRFTPEPGVSPSVVFLFSAVLLVVIAASLIDLAWGNHLYMSTTTYDWTGRVSITESIFETGVPPMNPSFHPGHALPLFYYYFWFLVCAVCEKLCFGLVNSRQALIAGSFYPALGLVSVVCLFLRFGSSVGSLANRWRIGILLLLVTGLDIIPWVLRNAVALVVHSGYRYAEIETWNSQISAWTGAVLWVPNHIAAFVAAGFILLSLEYLPQFDAKQARLLSILGGFATLSILGMSVWIGLMLALILAAWFLFALVRKWTADVWFIVTTGVLGVLLFLPFYLDLKAARHSNDPPLRVAVREFIPVEGLFRRLHIHSAFQINLAEFVFLPLNYFMELGFFAVVAFLQYRRVRAGKSPGRAEWLRIVIFSVTVFVCTFVRSSLSNNDFGWRCFMYAQLMLLLWAVDFIDEGALRWRTFTGKLLLVTLSLGVLGSAADFLMLRFSGIAADALAAKGEVKPSVRAFEEREAYRQVDALYPKSLFVQHNPTLEIDYYNSLLALRPAVVSDENYAFLYGIDRKVAADYVSKIAQPFLHDMPEGIRSFCAENGIAALAARDTDPVWHNPQSWVWTQKPVIATDVTRVFDCR